MPPHLHPKSTATSTLFAGTLLTSFIVVGIPHVFPCPRPRNAFSADAEKTVYDENGQPVARRKKVHRGDGAESVVEQTRNDGRTEATKARKLADEAAVFKTLEDEARLLKEKAQAARECPVPKPSGWMGRILGFDGRRAEVSNQVDKG